MLKKVVNSVYPPSKNLICKLGRTLIAKEIKHASFIYVQLKYGHFLDIWTYFARRTVHNVATQFVKRIKKCYVIMLLAVFIICFDLCKDFKK